MRFFVGGYTPDMDGAARGIGAITAGDADEVLAGGVLRWRDAVPVAGSPSWLAWHPTRDVLYAALEGAGTVQAFRRTGEDSFVALGAPVDAGELVCHVAVDPAGRFLLASCWGDGRLVRMELDAAGAVSQPTVGADAVDPYGVEPAPTRDVVADALGAATRALREAVGAEFAHLIPEFTSPPSAPPGGLIDLGRAGDLRVRDALDALDAAGGVHSGRQAQREPRVSRAHQAHVRPGGLVASTDMGLDLVRLWSTADGIEPRGQVVLPKGCGPRHMVWHPSGHLYVVTEVSHEVFALAPDPTGTWRIVGGSPLSPATRAGSDAAAEIALSRDGEFVYVGIRGSNTIATLRVRGSGAEFAPVALSESGVDWPRHHVIARDTLLVAGQRSHDAASLTIDARTGVPGRVRHRVDAPSPTHLLADRR